MLLLASPWALAPPPASPTQRGRYKNPRVRPAWYRSRQRTLTPAQKRAEAELWPQLGLSWTHGAPVDLDEAFGRSDTPRVLEIGCGTGEAIAELAAESPDVDFVGVDWFRGGLAAALQRLQDVGNVRLLRADAAALLDEGLPDAPLFDLALVFFPDPWRGSSERRIVCPEVARSLKAKMRPGGALWLATDVDDYPDHARRVLAAEGWAEAPCAEVLASARCPPWRRPSTKYERDGIAAGRDVCDVCWRCEVD